MAEATLLHKDGEYPFTAAAAYSSGEIITLPDGRPGVIGGLDAVASGDPAVAYTEGVFKVACAAATVFAVGAPVYWDASANLAITAPAAADDILLGVCVVASTNAQTTVGVDLGEFPLGISRSAFRTATVDIQHDSTAEHQILLASQNPKGCIVDELTGIVTEKAVGTSEDQLIATLYDDDDNALATLTFADAAADDIGDIIQGSLGTATVASGVVACVVPAGKGAYVKVTQATAGGSIAGAMNVSALVSPLV